MTDQEAKKRGVTPMARVVSPATADADPAIIGTGPMQASHKALVKAGWTIKDLDVIEANEAFAAQALAVNKDLGWNPNIVNVNSGEIAMVTQLPRLEPGSRRVAPRDCAPNCEQGSGDALHRMGFGNRDDSRALG